MSCDAVRAQLRECAPSEIRGIPHLEDCPGCLAIAESLEREHAAFVGAIASWAQIPSPASSVRASGWTWVVVGLAIAATLAFALSTLLPGAPPPPRPAQAPPIEALPESEQEQPLRSETEAFRPRDRRGRLPGPR